MNNTQLVICALLLAVACFGLAYFFLVDFSKGGQPINVLWAILTGLTGITSIIGSIFFCF